MAISSKPNSGSHDSLWFTSGWPSFGNAPMRDAILLRNALGLRRVQSRTSGSSQIT